MKGINSADDAIKQFQGLGRVPSLEHGPRVATLDRKGWEHAAEGLYGEGGRRYRQSYEVDKGMTWYAQDVPDRANPGKTKTKVSQTRLMDLHHLAEGKVLHYLKEGDQRQAAKNLERLLKEREILFNKVGLRYTPDALLATMSQSPAALGTRAGQLELEKRLEAIAFETACSPRRPRPGSKARA